MTRVLQQPVPGAPPRPRPPRPERWTLANGLRVAAAPRTTLPQVTVRVAVPAGSVADPPGASGLAALTVNLLTEGAGALSSAELHRRLDRLGASISAHVGHDFAEIDLHLLRETLPEGIVLLGDILRSPLFPDEELERLRAETIDGLHSRLDEPANVADDALGEALFGEHPYGRLPAGTIESVGAITRDQIVDFHRRHYRPQGAVLVAAGDFGMDELRSLLEHGLGNWHGRLERPSWPESPQVAPAAGRRIAIPWDDAQQAELRVGGIGMPRDADDWIPGSVANFLLGGSTITGRLGANLREDKGWTYGVRSGFSATVVPGSWAVETAVDAEVAEKAVDEIVRELTRFLAEPVPEEELRRAKDALILSLPRAFETPGRIVGRVAALELFGLAEDYWDTFADRVEAVTRDDLLRVAHAHFDPARLAVVAVGA